LIKEVSFDACFEILNVFHVGPFKSWVRKILSTNAVVDIPLVGSLA